MSTGRSGYDRLRYDVVPPVFLVAFTLSTQLLLRAANPEAHSGWTAVFGIATSAFAWKVVIVFFLWAFISLKVPSKKFLGPASHVDGYVPVYSANGTQYYLVSLAAFAAVAFYEPRLCLWIYEDFSAIVASLNISAMVICAVLLNKGYDAKRDGSFPLPYLFYRGTELHPRLLGVDVKQWSNCRVGMLGWALLVIVFAVAGAQRNGTVSPGAVVNAALINVYLLKFFYWETGYFNTLDITLDRAGYYLCWGCLCWVQVFYTYSAYYLVAQPSPSPLMECAAIAIFGTISLLLNYAADRQKEVFKANNGKCHIWGRPAKSMDVEYTDAVGKKRKSKLLLSGWWGVARHTNYLFELLLALSWSLPSARLGSVMPFLYVFFLTALLVHRTFRDEEKCSTKYGKQWSDYCKKVPYRIVPYVF